MTFGKSRVLRSARLTALIALLLIALSGCLLFTPSQTSPAEAGDYQLKIVMLDVGQGDSILLASAGQYMLIDAGESDMGDHVVSELKGMGVTRLTAVVCTHTHSDHIGGMSAVIRAFPADAVYLPKMDSNTNVYENLLDAVAARGLSITVPKPGGGFTLGLASIEFLWPPDGFKSDNDNDHSIVILVSAGGRKALLCGDIEKAAEKELLKRNAALACDVMKVAHHGSDTSTTRNFLSAAKPSIALISVGQGNSFKHPDKDVVQRLKDAGARVFRTDQNGTVTVTIAGGAVDATGSK